MLISDPPPSQGDLHFSLFGIPVRVHPMFWIVTLLFGMNGAEGKPDLVLWWVPVVFVSILVHELGHALTARAFGWPPKITLHGMGGLASFRPVGTTPTKQILVTLAGPAAGFVLGGLAIVAFAQLGIHMLPRLGGPMGIEIPLQVDPDSRLWTTFHSDSARLTAAIVAHNIVFVNVMWGLINLLPVYPLDGGQISREVLGLVIPDRSLLVSLQISVITAGALAAYSVLKLQDWWLALFFAYLGYTSYQWLDQRMGGGFGGGAWR